MFGTRIYRSPEDGGGSSPILDGQGANPTTDGTPTGGTETPPTGPDLDRLGDDAAGAIFGDTSTDGAREPKAQESDFATKAPEATNYDKLLKERFGGDVNKLAKSYTDLQKLMSTRADAIDDETLAARAKEKGLIPPGAPESYDMDGLSKVFTDAGWTPHAHDHETWKEFTEHAKKAGWTQEQAAANLQYYLNVASRAIEQTGPEIDRNAEVKKFSEKFGENSETILGELKDWATNNLPSELFSKPLGATAAGWEFLHNIMKRQRGATPILGNNAPSASGLADIDAKLNELVSHPGYRDSQHPSHKGIMDQFSKLNEQYVRMKARMSQ